jgi:hypothetical protein
MSFITRERLVNLGRLALTMGALEVFADSNQTSVSQAALDFLSGRGSIAYAQDGTVPFFPPTGTPTATNVPVEMFTATPATPVTPQGTEATGTPTPLPGAEATATATATPTGNGEATATATATLVDGVDPTPSATPTLGPVPTAEERTDELKLTAYDENGQPLEDVAAFARRENPVLEVGDTTQGDGTFTVVSHVPDTTMLEIGTTGPNDAERVEYKIDTTELDYNSATLFTGDPETSISSSVVISFTAQDEGAVQAASADQARIHLIGEVDAQNNTLTLQTQPDGTIATVSDLETSGSVSLQPIPPEVSASAESADQFAQGFEVVIFSGADDVDGFDLELTNRGATKSVHVPQEVAVQGTLTVNTQQVSSGGDTLSFGIDSDLDGVPDAVATVPIVSNPDDGDQTIRSYLPLVTR